MITDQESKYQVSYHSLHWNSAPCHHDHRSGVQGSGILSLAPLELRSMSSWSPIRSPRIRYFITRSTGTPLHVIIITDQESKDQVSYHSLHWNTAPCHHDHRSGIQGSSRLSSTLRASTPGRHDHWSGIQGSGRSSPIWLVFHYGTCFILFTDK
jgi:hypothetical protein